MNQLVPSAASRPPAQQPQPSATARETARLLKAAESLEAPWRLYQQMYDDHPGWYRELYTDLPSLDQLRHPECAERARKRAAEVLAAIPPIEVTAAVLAEIGQIGEAKHDRAQTLALIATMVDGFPNGRPQNPEAYVQSLHHEVSLAGHKPAIVARATRVIARTATFLPNIAEVLKACEEAAKIRDAFDRVLLSQDRRWQVEHALAQADKLGLRDLDQEWRDHIAKFKETGEWPFYGKAPGERGCRAPAAILTECGFPPPPEPTDAHGKLVPQR